METPVAQSSNDRSVDIMENESIINRAVEMLFEQELSKETTIEILKKEGVRHHDAERSLTR